MLVAISILVNFTAGFIFLGLVPIFWGAAVELHEALKPHNMEFYRLQKAAAAARIEQEAAIASKRIELQALTVKQLQAAVKAQGGKLSHKGRKFNKAELVEILLG